MVLKLVKAVEEAVALQDGHRLQLLLRQLAAMEVGACGKQPMIFVMAEFLFLVLLGCLD